MFLSVALLCTSCIIQEKGACEYQAPFMVKKERTELTQPSCSGGEQQSLVREKDSSDGSTAVRLTHASW